MLNDYMMGMLSDMNPYTYEAMGVTREQYGDILKIVLGKIDKPTEKKENILPDELFEVD